MTVVILGGVQPALNLARSLMKANCKVVVVCRNGEMACYSRLVDKFIVSDDVLVARAQLIDFIERLSQEEVGYRVLPASEFFLDVCEEGLPEGGVYLGMGFQQANLVRNKREVYSLSEKEGVKVPGWFPFEESGAVSEGAIVKWSLADSSNSGLPKTWRVSSQSQLEKLRLNVSTSLHSRLIVQEAVAGKSVSYGAYWVNGKPVCEIVVEQVRQYPIGVTSYVIEADDEVRRKVLDNISKVSSTFDFKAFVEVEFIYKEGELFLIDVNPRLWGWSQALFYKFPGLVDQVYAGGGEDCSFEKVENVRWANVIREVPAILKSGESLIVMLHGLFVCLFSRKISRTFIDFRDPCPEIKGILK